MENDTTTPKELLDALPDELKDNIPEEAIEQTLNKGKETGFISFGQLMLLIQTLTPFIQNATDQATKFARIRFYLTFGFAVTITTVIFGFSAWLIARGETSTGIAILTHVVALLAGAIGGSAIFKKSE